MGDYLRVLSLGFAGFLLGAVPFSLLVGWRLLGVDVRDYGDGNPGAANVFRAGGQKSGVLAVFLDVAKGVPVVLLAQSVFGLTGIRLVAVALCPVLGHAFSPFLRWRGGKSVAVTFGVLLALPEFDLLLAFIACVVLGFLFIEEDSWVVISGATGALVYITLVKGGSWESVLMLGILAVLVARHWHSLGVFPGFKGRFIRWLQSLFRGNFAG